MNWRILIQTIILVISIGLVSCKWDSRYYDYTYGFNGIIEIGVEVKVEKNENKRPLIQPNNGKEKKVEFRQFFSDNSTFFRFALTSFKKKLAGLKDFHYFNLAPNNQLFKILIKEVNGDILIWQLALNSIIMNLENKKFISFLIWNKIKSKNNVQLIRFY